MPLPEADDPVLVGQKAYTLGRLHRAGFDVPPGFVLTRHARVSTGMGTGPGQGNADSVTVTPSEIAAACRRWIGDSRAVAVRSSAVAEDGPQRSFAGQFLSVLDLHGAEAIIDAVARCRASDLDPRAEQYRAHRDAGSVPRADDAPLGQMPVVVQEMAEPDWAGVMFSVDPVHPDPTVLLIEVAPRSAASVCDGSVNPLRYLVDRLSLRLLDGSGDDVVPDPRLVTEVARVGLMIEQALGGPQDIEWAARDGERPRVSVLQGRPITTLRSAGRKQSTIADLLMRL